MVTCNDKHIKNSKNHKKMMLAIMLAITLHSCQCAE